MDMDYTVIAGVLDRSGSIISIKTDVEGGLKTFIEGQQELSGRCDFTLAQFDDVYEIVVPFQPIGTVDSTVPVEPRGSTALLDAIGRTVTELGARLDALPENERPGHVIVAIITDGLENSSREYTRQQINDMITHQREKYGWEFIFLAANQDAIAVGASYGVPAGSSMTFAPSGQGVRASTNSLNTYAGTVRGGGVAAFTDEDRKGAMEEEK